MVKMTFSPVDKTRETFMGVRHALEKIEQKAKLSRHRVVDYRPHIEFEFEKSHYAVKTAANGEELERCLKLRFEVFHREGLQKKRTFGVDIDKLDLICDHLAIFDIRDGSVIGTYRLNCSRFTGQFYSASEFHLGRLLELPGHKLELGRACIHKDYRKGAVINLLWRGIAEYLRCSESEYLFGCASIKTVDPLEIGRVYKSLQDRGLIDFSYDVAPKKSIASKSSAKFSSGLPPRPSSSTTTPPPRSSRHCLRATSKWAQKSWASRRSTAIFAALIF